VSKPYAVLQRAGKAEKGIRPEIKEKPRKPGVEKTFTVGPAEE